MIIPKSIEALYGRMLESLNILKYNVDQTLGNIAESLHIIYIEARIKPKESFIAKVEKDGYKNPVVEIGDLLACRLITRSNSNLDQIMGKLAEVFNIEQRSDRSYRPDQFIYDDIQLILSFKDNPLISNKQILGQKFELQIRTGLQDALAEVIRGETYKTDILTWQRERTASELRANLELMDTILSDFITASTMLEEKDYKPFQQRNEVIKLLKDVWETEKLPSDLRRASIIVEEYLRLAGTNIEGLSTILKLDKYKDIVESTSITPTQIILIILFLEKKTILDKAKNEKKCLLVTDEMIDICPELRRIDPLYRVNID